MKQIIYYKKGWNLVSFLFEIKIINLKNDSNILEIKSVNSSYNSSAPDFFNNLNSIKLNESYFIKCQEDKEFVLEGDFIDEIEYTISKGWNLFGFPFDFKYDISKLPSEITEVKGKSESYNREVTEFNTLNFLESDEGYWVKSKDNITFTIKNTNLIETYDIAIIGAGPAGCMFSKVISESDKFKDNKIVLLERGSFNIKKNFDLKYRNILSWQDAMLDSNNSESFLSSNNKLIWVGKGLGGGTLHFGLQYVDDIELYKDIPEIKYYLESVNNLTKTQKFDYDTKSTGLWRDIYDFFKNEDIVFCNNKIYSDDIKNRIRFVASDLLDGLPIDIKTNAEVKEIRFEDNKAVEVLLTNNKIIRFKKLILASGAIANVKILNCSQSSILSKLPIGQTIFDHAGINLYYSPSKEDFNTKYIPIGHLQVRSKDLKWQIYLNKSTQSPFLIVTIAQGLKNSNKGSLEFKPDQSIFINHFSDLDKPDTLIEAFNYIDKKLNELGFSNVQPETINNKYIMNNFDSIYHYHGTCPFNKVVDKYHKIIGTDNVYIADNSVLNKSVPGSTSVSSMTLGYRLAKLMIDPELLTVERRIDLLESEIEELQDQKNNYYTEDKLRDMWTKQNKMYVIIQNDGTRVGVGNKFVYDMGNFWRGGGHPVNLVGYLESNKYDFTNLLISRHGSYSAWRLERGGAIKVGEEYDGRLDQQISDKKKLIKELLEKISKDSNESSNSTKIPNDNKSYLPFTKTLVWNNSLTLVAMNDVSDDFINKIIIILNEMIPNNLNNSNLIKMFTERKFIQRIGKNDMSFYNPPLEERSGWDSTSDNNTAVDFIWEINNKKNQVTEVMEHLLHTVYYALQFINPDVWSFTNQNSLVNKAMQEAIVRGVYNINDYRSLFNEDENVYYRVIVQEFVFWIIYTIWGFTSIYKTDSSPEWNIFYLSQLRSLLPLSIELYNNHIENVIMAPKLETISKVFL